MNDARKKTLFRPRDFLLIHHSGASGLWNLGGAASGGSGAAAFASGPTPGTTVEDAANAGYPEWMVHEDYSLLQAVQVWNHGGLVSVFVGYMS